MTQSITVVFESTGSYEDTVDDPIGYFTDANKAAQYVDKKNAEAAKSNAIHDIVGGLLKDFAKTNPHPPYANIQVVPTIPSGIKQGTDVYKVLLAEKRKVQAENAAAIELRQEQVAIFVAAQNDFVRQILIVRGIVKADDPRLVKATQDFYVEATYYSAEVPALG